MRIKLTIAYDGSNYFGFQHQDNVLNIEDIILKAISEVPFHASQNGCDPKVYKQ